MERIPLKCLYHCRCLLVPTECYSEFHCSLIEFDQGHFRFRRKYSTILWPKSRPRDTQRGGQDPGGHCNLSLPFFSKLLDRTKYTQNEYNKKKTATGERINPATLLSQVPKLSKVIDIVAKRTAVFIHCNRVLSLAKKVFGSTRTDAVNVGARTGDRDPLPLRLLKGQTVKPRQGDGHPTPRRRDASPFCGSTSRG